MLTNSILLAQLVAQRVRSHLSGVIIRVAQIITTTRVHIKACYYT